MQERYKICYKAVFAVFKQFAYDCSSLKKLIWLVFTPNLKKIDVQNCSNMEEIISFRKISFKDNAKAELASRTQIFYA